MYKRKPTCGRQFEKGRFGLVQPWRVVAVHDKYQNVYGPDVVPPQLAHFVLPADVRNLDPGPSDVQPVDDDPVRGRDGSEGGK